MRFFGYCLIKLQILISMKGIDLFNFLSYIYHFQNTQVQDLQADTDSVIYAPHIMCQSCNTVAKQYTFDLGII
jgi:hypothetical protein